MWFFDRGGMLDVTVPGAMLHFWGSNHFGRRFATTGIQVRGGEVDRDTLRAGKNAISNLVLRELVVEQQNDSQKITHRS